MRKLTLTAQTAILWSTHQVEEIEEEDRVIILYDGEVYDDDTAVRLCEKYGKSLELVLLDLSRARSRELFE
jgi:ABC-type multidrug transport system ATPase subunit